jgi:hypothetical protein
MRRCETNLNWDFLDIELKRLIAKAQLFAFIEQYF